MSRLLKYNISELSTSFCQIKLLVELVGACNLIWYQIRVRGHEFQSWLAQLNKIIVVRSYIPRWRPKIGSTWGEVLELGVVIDRDPNGSSQNIKALNKL
jgi:hypothetical protein